MTAGKVVGRKVTEGRVALRAIFCRHTASSGPPPPVSDPSKMVPYIRL